MAAPTLTNVIAAGLGIGKILESFRETTLKTQTAGFQHLGTIKQSDGTTRYDVYYDVTGNIVYTFLIS